MILTAEADSLSTDEKKLLSIVAWWDATKARAMICQSTQELIPQGMFASYGSQVKKTTKIHMHAIFEVKFGKKAEGAITDSRERAPDSLACLTFVPAARAIPVVEKDVTLRATEHDVSQDDMRLHIGNQRHLETSRLSSNPVITPQDYDVLHSRRVLEL